MKELLTSVWLILQTTKEHVDTKTEKGMKMSCTLKEVIGEDVSRLQTVPFSVTHNVYIIPVQTIYYSLIFIYYNIYAI